MKTPFAISLSLLLGTLPCATAQQEPDSQHLKALTTSGFGLSNEGFELRWESSENAYYRIEYSRDLDSWESLGTMMSATEEARYLDAKGARLNRPTGFYRAILTEAPLGEALALDFTFPTNQVVEDLGRLQGITLLSSGEAVILLNDRRELIMLSLDGALLDRQAIETEETLTGLTTTSDKDTLIVAQSGTVFHYDWQAKRSSVRGNLPPGDYQGLAYHASSGSIGGLTQTGTLIVLGDDDVQGRFQNNKGLESATFTGIHAIRDSLYATALRNGEVWLVKCSLGGKLEEAWSIKGNPTGIVVREESATGPIVLTTNDDSAATVQQFEPPVPGSAVDAAPLPLLGVFELGEEVAPQPSGICLSPVDQRLHYVTDFGRVVSSERDGSDIQVLLDLSDAVQGTFESIVVDSGGQMRVLASDSRTPTRIEIFDSLGNQLGTEPLEMEDELVVVEGYAIDALSGDQWWVNGSPGEAKSLYRKPTEGDVRVYPLPEAFGDLTISGLELAGEFALLVTEESEVDGERLAGLLIVWEWKDGEEEARYSLAVPNDEGELEGIVDPSGVAYDSETGAVYITSDNDDGEVYVFDLDTDEDDDDDD